MMLVVCCQFLYSPPFFALAIFFRCKRRRLCVCLYGCHFRKWYICSQNIFLLVLLRRRIARSDRSPFPARMDRPRWMHDGFDAGTVIEKFARPVTQRRYLSSPGVRNMMTMKNGQTRIPALIFFGLFALVVVESLSHFWLFLPQHFKHAQGIYCVMFKANT